VPVSVDHKVDALPLGQSKSFALKSHARWSASVPAIGPGHHPGMIQLDLTIQTLPITKNQTIIMFGIQNVDRGEDPTNQQNSNGLANTPEAPTRFKKTIQVILDAIQTMELVSMVDLAETYYRKSTLDDNGETRKIQNSEVIVLVPDHLRNWLENSGFGANKINGRIHFFVGTHWQPIEDAECEALLGLVAARIGHDVSDSKSYIFCRKLFRQFHFSLPPVANESKRDQVLINFKNGTLEISSSNEVLRDFCKMDNLAYQLPFDYDEDAKCLMFEKFLFKVLPDIESRQILSEFLGWAFLKDLKLEKALFLHGSGHNGKSVIFDIVNALLGENNIENLNLSSLSKLENRFRLGTVLLNFGSDINDRCDIEVF
jgi:putative DNA primase/helicase